MPDAPERIFHWVGQNTRTRIEYVHADLFNAQRKELERLRAKVGELKTKLEWAESREQNALMRAKPPHVHFPTNPAQEDEDA